MQTSLCGNLGILTFMATLLSKDQVKFSELNSDFSNQIFVSCFKLSKTYSPCEFFKDGLKLYIFESPKVKFQIEFFLKCLKFGLSWGKNSRYALCDASYICL